MQCEVRTQQSEFKCSSGDMPHTTLSFWLETTQKNNPLMPLETQANCYSREEYLTSRQSIRQESSNRKYCRTGFGVRPHSEGSLSRVTATFWRNTC